MIRRLQIVAFIANHTTALVVFLAVVALIGGALTAQAYAGSETELETVEESSWSETAQYDHQAPVVTETDVFEEDDVLENQPAYLESITPVLSGTYLYEYTATDGGELNVSVEHTRVLRSVDAAEDSAGNEDEFEYWRNETQLATATAESVEPGEEVAVPFLINVTESVNRIETLEAQVGGTPGETEFFVESQLTISGERNGESVNESAVHEFSLDEQGGVYYIETTEPKTDSGEQHSQEVVQATASPFGTTVGPLVLVLSLGGLLALAVGRWQNVFELSESEQAWLAYQRTTDEYEEWISRGTIPHEALSRPTIEVESLEGLVHIGIDSNRRVIEDTTNGVCVVLLEDGVYRYERPDFSSIEPLQMASPPSANGESTADTTDDRPADEEQLADDEQATSDDQSSVESKETDESSSDDDRSVPSPPENGETPSPPGDT